METQIEWTLSLDADGKIAKLAPINENNLPALREQIEPVVHTWHFTPGKVGGQPALTETTLRVGVALDPTHGSEYQGHITFATTGPVYQHMVKPEYPETAQHFGHEGAVIAAGVDTPAPSPKNNSRRSTGR